MIAPSPPGIPRTIFDREHATMRDAMDEIVRELVGRSLEGERR